jgi:hypothetical protein
MSRLASRVLAVLVPAALLVPAASHAATVAIDDASGDAQAINMAAVYGEMFDGTTTSAQLFLDAPAETSTDVVRTTIDHARKRLTLTVQFRDLVEIAGHSVEFRIFTPEGRFDLIAGRLGDRTIAELSPGRGGVVVVSGDGVVVGPEPKPCRTVRARYDLTADTLTASVPNACIGSPKWVQVAAGVSRTKVTPQEDGSVNLAGYVDDAFRGGVSMRSLGRSPKVRRG